MEWKLNEMEYGMEIMEKEMEIMEMMEIMDIYGN